MWSRLWQTEQLAETMSRAAPSLSLICGSSASAGAASRRAAARLVTASVFLIIASLGSLEVELLDRIVVIAGRVPHRLLRLAGAQPVGGAHHHAHRAGGRRHVVAPAAEGIFAEILAELRRTPGPATIGRDRYFADAVAAIPGDAAQRHLLPGLQRCAVEEIGDQRVDD